MYAPKRPTPPKESRPPRRFPPGRSSRPQGHGRLRPLRKIRRPIPPAKLQGLVLSALFATVLLVLAGLTLAGPKAPELDRAGCPLGATPDRSLVVVADLTDKAKLGPQQLKALESEIRLRAGRLAAGDRLSVFVLASDGQDAPAALHPLFSRCRPLETGDGPTVNRQMIEANFRKTWIEPLAGLRDAVAGRAGRGSPNTPLMATLKDLGRSDLFKAEGERALVLLTDLLEHDPGGFTHYRRDFPDFEVARRRSLHVVDNDGVLSGVRVFVLLLSSPRSAAYQSKRLFAFWEAWMGAADVADFKVNRI